MSDVGASSDEVDFQAIARLQSDLVFRLDAEGRLCYVSEGAERFFGRSRAETVGEHFSEVLQDAALGRAGRAFRRLLEGDPIEEVELELEDGEGQVHVVRVTAEPVVEDGAVVGARGVAVDITDRRRRTQVVEVFDRVLRHNLRNAMNLVVGEAARMRDRSDDEVVMEASRRITSAGDELLDLADAARDVHRVVVDERRSGPTDPVAETREVCDRLAGEFPDADLTVDLPAGEPLVPDAGLDIAIHELVENALRHAGPAPDVTVELERPAPETVRLRVRDDGPGLPEIERAVLREGGEGPLRHGQGLGLWLVNWVVSESEGRMDIDAEAGVGTTVTVDLPVVATDDSSAPGGSQPADADD